MSTPETHNIVILGASCAGLSAFHYTAKHILPSLPSGPSTPRYHIYLINPSVDFYWRIGAPRAAASAALMSDEKVFLPIAPHVAQYGSEDVTFMLGTAVGWDEEARTVTVASVPSTTDKEGEGEEQSQDEEKSPQTTLPYHALLLCTGTTTPSPLLSTHTSNAHTRTALSTFRAKLPTAHSIYIAGGGPAGVELAGELGEYLNGRASFFASGPLKPEKVKVQITLGTAGEGILPALRPALGREAERMLGRVGVRVAYGARMTGVVDNDDGSSTVTLENGESVTADLVVVTTGVSPNTSFVPEKLRTEKGYVACNGKTLRVDGAGPRVYALGDVGSYTRGGVMDIYDAVPVCMTNVSRDLRAWASADSDGKEGIKPKGRDREYVANEKETQLVPVGQSKGVGAVFGWKLPSLMVWAIKGRDYLAASGVQLVEGSKWKKESKWKVTDA